jgi:alpha-mannosidase
MSCSGAHHLRGNETVHLALTPGKPSGATAVFHAVLPPCAQPVAVGYRSPAGALLRVDGVARGAFDLQHHEVVLPPSADERALTLEVELFGLPTNGLPSRPGVWWRWINRRGRRRPARTLSVEPHPRTAIVGESNGDALAMWGHSHLDVAWLWTYADTQRKATRTFANAAALLEADPSYVFIQSQPQLYDFVRVQDPELFSRVERFARAGRFDPDVAAMWVEPDCNVPSGESLLRQMLAAHRFCFELFGIEPSIVWLPDTFGFARTLPTLLAHAGIGCFATTKLQWNDTNRFPHPQFRWRGPDGSEVLGALIDRMEGGCGVARRFIARRRREPLVVGYGDGGGGPTAAQLEKARGIGRWERPRAWFERLAERRSELPIHADELYLEYHRGVYTTHHDVKASNAGLERRLRDLEEQAAWCVAVRAPSDAIARLRIGLQACWEIVLRNQFHDVLPGTSITDVYADVREEYRRANALLDAAEAAMAAMLPRAARGPIVSEPIAPVPIGDFYAFENERLRALVEPSGALAELTLLAGGRNFFGSGNELRLYRDRPKRWEAWNVDSGYERLGRAAISAEPRCIAGGLEVPFDLGRSRATMRVALHMDEPFLRVQLAVDWRERRTLLRHVNRLSVRTDTVLYGAPHGVVERSSRDDTPQRRARFEVPGQRFAMVCENDGAGLACLALDTYGWSARLVDGGLQLGHSLLRATTWPDPTADEGEHQLSWAYAPLDRATIGTVERLWEDFAGRTGVRLFESDQPGVVVTACKPAEDGDGVIVRVRECDGRARTLRLRCGGRMRGVESVDGLERRCDVTVGIDGESILADIGPFALRSFRVRF